MTNTFKTRFSVFLFQGGYETLFLNLRRLARLSNLIEITDKDVERKSLKVLTRGNGISKGQTFIFIVSQFFFQSETETLRVKQIYFMVTNPLSSKYNKIRPFLHL